MSELTSAFVELIRRASVQLRLYCIKCGFETMHSLTGETMLDEIYTCPRCQNQTTYRVR